MNKQPLNKGKIYGSVTKNILTIPIGKFEISFGKVFKEYKSYEELKEILIENFE